MNELCTVWFAVSGVRVGMNCLCVLHSVRMVWLRLGDVSGCAEWAVHSVICCWLHESRIGFSLCFTTLCGWFLLRFGDASGCVEWAVHSVICCWLHESRIGFPCVLQHCAFGFVKIWWCQWMCWMSRAQCDLLLAVWVLAMAWDSVFLRARNSGVSFG